MSSTFIKTLLIGYTLISLGGCAGSNKTLVGTGVGAGVGTGVGYGLGKAFGGRDGGWIGALIGAGTGALIGGAIGHYLDERDQQIANQATARALNAPTSPGSPPPSVTWKSDHNNGVGGNVTVTGVGYDQNGRECKKTTHTVYAGGKEHIETGMSCQDKSTGGWVRVS